MRRLRSTLQALLALLFASGMLAGAGALSASPSKAATVTYAATAPRGELDCNGFSPIQQSLRPMHCTDIRGFTNVANANTWGGKFYDNGHYIGHDEPDTTFLSTSPGSGNDVSWGMKLGSDPAAAPTNTNPGHDVSHWFELSPAPWLSMALCDSNSYPQLPCTPESDANAPACPDGLNCSPDSFPGGGAAVMEMQFYPPGNPPFADSTSCDDTHWCAALTIDSLECTNQFASCNTQCEEPANFAFIQTNGVPSGPPSPQLADLATTTPNAATLLMGPGDQVSVHMSDAPAPGGGDAFKVVIDDLTQHTSGSMQASASNGFANTSMADCSGTPHNFQPEYSTAAFSNVVPWAALQTNISTEFETGHFEPCTTLSDPITNPFDPSDSGGTYNGCAGAYESAGGPEGPELGDEVCYAAGDTHPGFDGPGSSTAPNEATGCQANVLQNGDLDFDGSPYWPEWPTGTTPNTYPSSFVESLPTTRGQQFPQLFIQTDLALSEASCTPDNLAGCTVPPAGPGNFYPYWSEVKSGATCALEFGNVSTGRGVNDLGADAQYGANQIALLGFPEFEGPILSNTCPATPATKVPTAFTISESITKTGKTFSDVLSELGLPLNAVGTVIFETGSGPACSINLTGLPGEATSCVASFGTTLPFSISAVFIDSDGTYLGSDSTNTLNPRG